MVLHAHRGNEAIPLPPQGLDALRSVRLVAKRPACSHDTALHGRIIDVRVWPELFQQFLLENHTVAMLNKVGKDLMYLRSQQDRDSRLP
jgi:hypothetical protein